MSENQTLYFFQGLASILVVFIHCPFPGLLGIIVTAWARIAVPLFFMISGYTLYYYLGTKRYRIKVVERIKRNGAITIIGLIVYFLADIIKCILKNESVFVFLKLCFSKASIIKLVLLGVIPPGSGGVLWFMIALVYIYIALYFIEPLLKKEQLKKWGLLAFIFMVSLCVVKIFVTYKHAHLGSFYLGSNWIFGNWISIGFPSVIMGMSMRKMIEEEYFANLNIHFVFVTLALCLVLTALESLILNNKINMYLSYTIYTLMVDCSIFVLAQHNLFSSNNLIVKIGKYYSRNLYLWHPLIMSAVSISIAAVGGMGSTTIQFFKPLFVVLLSLLLSLVLNILERRFRNAKLGF